MRPALRRIALFAALAVAAGTACAAAPSVSLRPVPRPAAEAGLPSGAPSRQGMRRVPVHVPGVVRSPRPVPRPELRRAARAARQVGTGAAGPAISLRPAPRPRLATLRTGRPAAQRPARRTRAGAGPICGDSAIRGERIAPVTGRLRGCGIDDPVRVTEVEGVRLSRPSVMTCETAKALGSWIREGARPAVGRLGGGVSGLRVFAHYACRTRNSRRGARISEHGKGRAIDIGAIMLANGVEIEVESGWRDRVQGPLLRRMHAAACGPFGTVLGPDSDRYHRDHLHFDTARHRSGPYCR